MLGGRQSQLGGYCSSTMQVMASWTRMVAWETTISRQIKEVFLGRRKETC